MPLVEESERALGLKYIAIRFRESAEDARASAGRAFGAGELG